MVFADLNTDLWREIIGKPSLEELVRRPENLSFYVASKMPISETARQELLEMNGISYRLRREIQLLRDFNHLRCKNCMVVSRSPLCLSFMFCGIQFFFNLVRWYWSTSTKVIHRYEKDKKKIIMQLAPYQEAGTCSCCAM